MVNAWPVPVRPLPPSPTAADAYALLAALYQLTIQNRRALVALGHTPFECGHILFASDSDFKFDQADSVVPWSKIGAAVGLHHGSANEAHDHIYERLDGAVLARSGSCPVLWTHSGFTLCPRSGAGVRGVTPMASRPVASTDTAMSCLKQARTANGVSSLGLTPADGQASDGNRHRAAAQRVSRK